MTAAALPAYAADLAKARRRGLTLRHPVVSVALHWRKRPSIGYGVVIADDTEPGDLDWTWIRGLEVFIWRRGDSAKRLMKAITAIEAGGPRRLLVVDVQESNVISILAPDVDSTLG